MSQFQKRWNRSKIVHTKNQNKTRWKKDSNPNPDLPNKRNEKRDKWGRERKKIRMRECKIDTKQYRGHFPEMYSTIPKKLLCVSTYKKCFLMYQSC